MVGRTANVTPRRVLVTAGGTKAPIDGVRAITNTSTGATGSAIADHFVLCGHEVTLFHADNAVLPPPRDSLTFLPFTTFDDLDALLRDTLGSSRFDAVIHVAAVGDYTVDHIVVDGRPAPVVTTGKLESGTDLAIHLRKNPKLLAQLKEIGGEHLVVVGFKLTNGATPEQRREAVASLSAADVVVHNDLTEIAAGGHRATIHRDGTVVATVEDGGQLAAALERCINDLIDS